VASAAKVLKNFTAEFQKPIVKVGVVDRAVLSGDQVKAIADLPAAKCCSRSCWACSSRQPKNSSACSTNPLRPLARVLKAKSEKEGAVA